MTTLGTRCPGCGGVLPIREGPTHRYIGASPACWAIYSAMGVGEPPIAPAPHDALLVDAYAVQHPGVPSDQATQSVAVHLLALFAVLERATPVPEALGVRRRALRGAVEARHARFEWLTPPEFDGGLTVAAVAAEPTPKSRAAALEEYVTGVWSAWETLHRPTVAGWYERYVVPDQRQQR